MVMTGMYSGAKNNKLIGYIRSIDFNQALRSTISEDGLNFVEKICLVKIWKGIKER
jgi:hypothetical protein